MGRYLRYEKAVSLADRNPSPCDAFRMHRWLVSTAPVEPTEEKISDTPVPFDLAAYKATVSASFDSISGQAILLSNMGEYEYNYWKINENIGGTFDSAKVADAAENWLIEKAEIEPGTLSKNHELICKQYKEIVSMTISGVEAEKIYENYDVLFTSYNSMYLLVTAPSGSRSDFANSFNSCTEEIKNRKSVLSVLLSE